MSIQALPTERQFIDFVQANSDLQPQFLGIPSQGQWPIIICSIPEPAMCPLIPSEFLFSRLGTTIIAHALRRLSRHARTPSSTTRHVQYRTKHGPRHGQRAMSDQGRRLSEQHAATLERVNRHGPHGAYIVASPSLWSSSQHSLPLHPSLSVCSVPDSCLWHFRLLREPNGAELP